jgi:hypothetical protein
MIAEYLHCGRSRKGGPNGGNRIGAHIFVRYRARSSRASEHVLGNLGNLITTIFLGKEEQPQTESAETPNPPKLQIRRNSKPSETPNLAKLQICRNSKSAETLNPTKLRIRPNSKCADTPNPPKLQIRRNSKSAETLNLTKLRIRPNSKCADTPNLPKLQVCRSNSPARQITYQSGGRRFRTDLEGAFEAAHD